MTDTELDARLAARFADLALGALHREYPNKITHILNSDADVAPPRELTPTFYGCFDWHSAVHGHWCLVRLVRCVPGAPFDEPATRALDRSFRNEHVAGELDYLSAPGRRSYEVPYGMAWLLTLARELGEWQDPRAERWQRIIAPLERLAVDRMLGWLGRLPWPVRTGEHTQSAFGIALLLDWARARGRADVADQAARATRALYGNDRDGPLHLEPSAYDFFSPCLAEADLLRRVLDAREYADWLTRFLPQLSAARRPFLEPVRCPDPSDGKLAHLDGLNLSRAWMLEGIAGALAASDNRRGVLLDAARAHREAGVAAVTGEHYEGSHWQGSFAVYLLTRRGA